MGKNNSNRIGIFGGSFDPVHIGHLLVAFAAKEELQLQQMVFVPTAVSPFKNNGAAAGFGVRLQMLRLALAAQSWTRVSDAEGRRGGVSYTVDTVRTLKSGHSDTQLFLLIGADNLEALPQWHEAEALSELVEIAIIPRPGFEAVEAPSGFRVHPLRGWPVSISSSLIRDRVGKGLAVNHLVPAGVGDVIRNNRLYLQ